MLRTTTVLAVGAAVAVGGVLAPATAHAWTPNPARAITVTAQSGIAFDRSGHLYLCDTTLNRVWVYDPGATTPNPAKTMMGVAKPQGIAVDSANHVYVANFDLGTVSVFDPGTHAPNAAKTLINVDHPGTVAIDSTHHVYVTSLGANLNGTTVAVFEPGATVPNPARTLTGLAAPMGIAIDATDHVYVSNVTAAKVSVFEPGAKVANPARLLTGAWAPVGVAVDSRQRVYVVNGSMGGGTTVSVYDPGATVPNPMNELTGLKGPAIVAVAPDDSVYVTDPLTSKIVGYDPIPSRPGQAGKPKVTSLGKKKVKIKWAAAPANGQQPTYWLQVAKPGKPFVAFKATKARKFVGKVPGAKKGRTLLFRIMAANAAGTGPFSPTTTAKMK